MPRMCAPPARRFLNALPVSSRWSWKSYLHLNLFWNNRYRLGKQFASGYYPEPCRGSSNQPKEMTMKKYLPSCVLMALLLGISNSQASEFDGLYVGVNAGSNKSTATSLSDKSNSY